MFLASVSHDGRFHLTIDRLLGPVGGRDKAIEASELSQQTHQAHPTGPDVGTSQVDGEHQAMQEGKPRATLKKGHHGGMGIKALVMSPPRPKGATGHLKCLGRLP
jgi:hypothetical protein